MRRLAWVLTVVLLSCVTASGQSAYSWIGQKVVIKAPTTLKNGNQDVSYGSEFRLFTVERTDGNRLWLVSDDISGWVQESEVVPFDQAINFCTKQIRDGNDLRYAYNLRGCIWDEKGEYDKAIADFSEAIKLDPTSPSAFQNRGLAKLRKNDYENAIEDYNAAIRLDPGNPVLYYNRGSAYYTMRKHDKAIADFNEALRLDPKSAGAYTYRGNTWHSLRDYEKASVDLDEAIRLDPKLAWAYNGRAWIWATCPDAKFRDGKRALEYATRACELSGWMNPDFLETLAAANAESGDYEAAVKWQTRVVELTPTDSQYRDILKVRLELFKLKKPYREDRLAQ
jgi:tetratricopeptide (TPR) repeat protein